MVRDLSQAMRLSGQVEHTDSVYIELVTIAHERLSEPIRVANNSENVTSNGDLYIGLPFEISIPSDIDRPPQGQLDIQNVDRVIGEAIQKIETPPRVTIQLILSDDPDDVALKYDHFFLQEISVDALMVSGKLSSFNYSQEPYPRIRGTQAMFPNLYR